MTEQPVTPECARVLRQCAQGTVHRAVQDGDALDEDGWRAVDREVRWLESAGLVCETSGRSWPRRILPTGAGQRWLSNNPKET